MRISANGPGHFKACICTHKVKPVVCSFMDGILCRAVVDHKQDSVLHTLLSLALLRLWRKEWSTWQFSLLAFSFSLHLLFEAWCLSPSLPLTPTPTHRLQKTALLPATWRFPLHPGFSTSCFPLSWREPICASLESVSKSAFTPNSQLVLQACLFTSRAEWLGEMITLSMLLIWHLKHPCWCHEGMGASPALLRCSRMRLLDKMKLQDVGSITFLGSLKAYLIRFLLGLSECLKMSKSVEHWKVVCFLREKMCGFLICCCREISAQYTSYRSRSYSWQPGKQAKIYFISSQCMFFLWLIPWNLLSLID